MLVYLVTIGSMSHRPRQGTPEGHEAKMGARTGAAITHIDIVCRKTVIFLFISLCVVCINQDPLQ